MLLSSSTDGRLTLWDLRAVAAAVATAQHMDDIDSAVRDAWQTEADASGGFVLGSVVVHQSGVNGVALMPSQQSSEQVHGGRGENDGDGEDTAASVLRIATCGDDNAVCASTLRVGASHGTTSAVELLARLSAASGHAANATCCVAIDATTFATCGADCRLNLWSWPSKTTVGFLPRVHVLCVLIWDGTVIVK